MRRLSHIYVGLRFHLSRPSRDVYKGCGVPVQPNLSLLFGLCRRAALLKPASHSQVGHKIAIQLIPADFSGCERLHWDGLLLLSLWR